jgi:beta-lactamase regulating signal transducer with metallopeptidase domain
MDLTRCLLVSIGTLSILVTIYYFVLRHKTSLPLRRAALLLILLTTILLPFIQIEATITPSLTFDNIFVPQKSENYTLTEADLLEAQLPVLGVEEAENVALGKPLPSEVSSFEPSSWWSVNWFLILYLVGFIIVSLRFLGQFIHFFYAVFKHHNIKKNGHHFVLLNQPNYAATFMHYILISKNIWESKDKSLIVQHECVHAQLRHSVDRFLTEILCLFQWFNPFIYWFRKNLIEVHEYQVDQALLADGVDAIQYQQLIAKYASLSNQFAFGNHFSHSLTLNRIKMIAQNKLFQKHSSYRLLLLLPVIGLLFSFFSFQIPKTATGNTNNALTGEGVTAPLIPTEVDFAGELLPMDNFDAKERFDRELISNCFRHSSTLLFLKKANRYFPIIEPILAKHGVPDDIKYLAVAESALSNATSPMGAKGFWQFMPNSAKERGLEVNKEVDERYHLEKATVAACEYLKEAHKQLGSWTLAAAAYNMGGPGLRKQLKKQGGQSYFDLQLNAETARYVLRIMAIKTIMQAPNAYGFNLSKKDLYPPMPKFKTIIEKGSILDLAAYAKKHQISYRMLKLYNPWLLDATLNNKEQRTYSIKIPLG